MVQTAVRPEVVVKPFGIKDKIGYMFGDFGNNIMVAMCNMLFLKFYTDVMNINAAIIGTIMTIVALLTIFANIFVGHLVDHSRTTKHGKFKPWILRIAGPFAVASFLMYATWLDGASDVVKLIWMTGTYVLWLTVFYTSMEIPYGSMLAAISEKTDDRTRLSNYRNLGGTVGMSLISVLFPLFVFYKNSHGDSVLSGSRMMLGALGVSVVAVICYMLVYALTTERVPSDKDNSEKIQWKALGRAIITNRALMAVVFVVVLREISNTAIQGMASYVYPNYFHNTVAMSLAGLLATILSIVVFLFAAQLGIWLGKKVMATAANTLIAVALLMLFILHTHNAYVWVVFYLVEMLGVVCFSAVSWAFIGDLIDDSEIRTGRRTEGTITSVFNMSMQIGDALSTLVVGLMLSGIGYTAATKFAPHVVHGIYDIATLAPMIGFFIAAVVTLLFYPISKNKAKSNSEFLMRKHAEEAAKAEASES